HGPAAGEVLGEAGRGGPHHVTDRARVVEARDAHEQVDLAQIAQAILDPRLEGDAHRRSAPVRAPSGAGGSRSTASTASFQPRGPGQGARSADGRARARSSATLPSGRGTRTGRSTACSIVRSFGESPRATEATGPPCRARSCRTARPLSAGPVRWWKRPPQVTRRPRRPAAAANADSAAVVETPPSMRNGSPYSRAAPRPAPSTGRPVCPPHASTARPPNLRTD